MAFGVFAAIAAAGISIAVLSTAMEKIFTSAASASRAKLPS